MAEGQSSGEIFTLWITIAVLAMTALAIMVIFIFRLAIKKVKEEKEKMRQAEIMHQQKLLYNSISIQERERKRIAADLHDELASRLNVIKLNVYATQKTMPEWAEQTNHLLDEAIAISRNISHDLYPPLLADLGIIETLRDYVHPLRQQMHVHLEITGTTNQLTKEQELQLFRLFQEQLQNVIKHAKATTLEILLSFRTKELVFLMRDDGIGYNPEYAKSGLGLINVESRVQMLKGKYKIKTAPGKGTALIITIPL